jgi:cytochrome c peroxidase
VLNTAFGLTMFWDGRAPSLEGQAQGPVQNKIEMGDQSYKEIIERLRTIPGYRDQFKKVFGTEVTLDGVAKAIAAFERTALSGNSPYDRYDQGDSPESLKLLSDSAKRGMVLFGLRLRQDDEFKPGVPLKKANCTSCHAGANFTDEQFHNLGVGWDASSKKFADLGRFAISPIGAKNNNEIGAFKTPTVREVVKTAPYMHDGSEKTLEAVMELYNRGGNANPHLDPAMKPLNLTAQEKVDVIEFMKALTGEEVKVALPTLPPGPDGKSPDPRGPLTPPSPPRHAAIDDPHGVIGH